MFEYDRHSALVHHRLAMSMLAGRMRPNFGNGVVPSQGAEALRYLLTHLSAAAA